MATSAPWWTSTSPAPSAPTSRGRERSAAPACPQMPRPPAADEASLHPSGTVTTPPQQTGAPVKGSRPIPWTPTPRPCTRACPSLTHTPPIPGGIPRARPTGPRGPCMNCTRPRAWIPTTPPCSCPPLGPPTCLQSPPTTMSTSWTLPPPGRDSSHLVMSPRHWLSIWTQGCRKERSCTGSEQVHPNQPSVTKPTHRYQTNPQLPIQPAVTNPTHQYQTNLLLPNQPTSTNQLTITKPTQRYQTNPPLPNQPSVTKPTHQYQTNPTTHDCQTNLLLPNQPTDTKPTRRYQPNPALPN